MKLRDIVIAGLVGVGAAVLRLVCLFFPLMNLVDVVVFGLAGYGVGRTNPTRRWASFLLVVLPALACIAVMLVILGTDKLRNGVGTGHLYGALLIPVAAGVGFLAASRGEKRFVAT